MLNFFVKLLELPLSTEERLVYVFLRGSGALALGVGIEGHRRRPPAVAVEEEASPTTTSTTSRWPKWTSVSAAEADQCGDQCSGCGRRNRGRSGPARQWWVAEDLLVGGQWRFSSWAGG